MVELQTRRASRVSSQLIKSDLIKRGLELANSVEAEIQRHPNRVSAGSGLVMPEPVVPQDASWAHVWVKRGLNKYKRGNYLGAVDNFRLAIDKQAKLVGRYSIFSWPRNNSTATYQTLWSKSNDFILEAKTQHIAMENMTNEMSSSFNECFEKFLNHIESFTLPR